MRIVLFYILFCYCLASAQEQAPRDTMTIRFERAKTLYNEHDDTGEALAEAELEFQTLLKQTPNFPQAIAYLGLIALERRNSPLDDSFFNAALKIDSTLQISKSFNILMRA